MAFDPDAYLATPFDPDAYLKGQQPAAPPAAAPALTWEALQAQVKDLPEADRVKAVRNWSDTQEKQASTEGGWGRYVGDVKRSVTRGLPGGPWLDEAQAKISSMLPESAAPLWSGAGQPYEQTKAQEDARIRRIETESPKMNLGAGLGGALAGAVATGQPSGLLGRIGLDTAVGAVSGAGEGDTTRERATNALFGGALSGAASSVLNKFGNWYNRWTQQTPEVVAAAERQGVNLPFFATAENPAVQVGGRQAAQSRPAVAATWEAANRDVPAVGERLVTGVTGAPSETAPAAAGRAIIPGIEDATRSLSDQMGALAEQTRSRMPVGAKYDMSNLRETLGKIVAGRESEGFEKPLSGLGQPTNLATSPGGATFEGAGKYATRTGQRIGTPELGEPRKVSPAEDARLLGATRADQERMVQQGVGRQEGPWVGATAAQTFKENLGKMSQVAGMRSEVGRTANAAPEQLISRAYNYATTKGTGTRLDDLSLLVNSLKPEEQRQLGAGVLAQIQNQSGGSAAGIAQRLSSMPQEARDLLFRPGTQEAKTVADLMTLSGRLGDINQLRHVGSAASVADAMTKNKYYDMLTSPALMATQAGLAVMGVPHVAAALPFQAAGWAIPRAMTAANTRLLNRGLPTPAVPQTIQDLATQMSSAVSRESDRWPIGYGR